MALPEYAHILWAFFWKVQHRYGATGVRRDPIFAGLESRGSSNQRISD
jgi:hypothetical protein